MKDHLVETLIGAAVIAVATLFLFFAYGQTEQTSGGGYTLTATLDNAAGIGVGTDVRIAGIKVGTVTSAELNKTTYNAVLEFTVESDIDLPEDSSLRVAIEGILGGTYLAIQVGGEFETMLRDGDEIVHTQGSLDIVGLIQRAVFGAGGGSD